MLKWYEMAVAMVVEAEDGDQFVPKEAEYIYKRDRVMHVMARASGDQQTEK